MFDCDGVLVDSEPIANRILVEMLNEAGFPISLEQSHRELNGLSLASCWKLIERRFGRPVPAGFEARLQARTFAALADAVEAVPGVGEAIAAIDVPICVASSGEPEKMRITLGRSGLLPLFDGRLFSALEVARGKPHPDLFLHAAARMGVAPARAVVVEDAVPGVQGARAAGMKVFAYAAAPHANRAGLMAAGAILFDDMRELPRLLGFAA
ncbi:MAG: HAD family hydrolase [Alphaproteobacteria bacterium]|nr:HAD family hydrolase [Alphaproteobacteria bacterium]